LNFQLKNPADVTGGTLQPTGAGGAARIFPAEDATHEINADRLNHFKPKPEEPAGDAERVLAQSIHPQVSIGAGVVVNS
jgi:hypothetical protein